MPHQHLVHIKPNKHSKPWSPLTCPQPPLCYKSHWLSVLQRAFLKGARWSRAVKRNISNSQKNHNKERGPKDSLKNQNHVTLWSHVITCICTWFGDSVTEREIVYQGANPHLRASVLNVPPVTGPCLQPDLSIKIRDDLFGQHAHFQNSLKIKFKSNWTKYAIVTSYHDIP